MRSMLAGLAAASMILAAGSAAADPAGPTDAGTAATNGTAGTSAAADTTGTVATPTDTATHLGPVVVTAFLAKGALTATKLDIPVRDTPLSVSSYTGSFMKAIETTEMADLYRYMTGVARAGNTGYDMVIRGFKTSGNDRNAIMTDGLPGLTVRFGSPPTIGVDHIEVVKGAASILYGQEQPGGFVNIITKKPQERQSEEVRLTGTSVSTPYGTQHGYDADFDVTGPIDSKDRFLYRVIGELGDTNQFRHDSYERPVYLAPSLAWNISDDTTALLQFEYRHVRTSYDTYLVAPALDINRVASIYTVYQQPTDAQEETGRTATLTLDHAFGHGIHWIFHYRHVGHEDSASGFDVVAVRPNDLFVERRARGQVNRRIYDFGDTYLTAPFHTAFIAHKLVAGVQYGIEADDLQRTQFYNAPPPPSPFTADIAVYDPNYATALPLASYPLGSLDDRASWSRESGVYLSDLMTFSPHWKGMLGLRYARESQTLDNYTPSRFTPTKVAIDGASTSTVLPMGGLIYQPTDTLSFYASYSTSLVPQSSGSQDPTGNGNLPPTQGESYEVGSKDSFWENRANVTFAAFRITETNVLNHVDCIAPTTGTCSAPIGQEQSKGIEVELNLQPLPNWQILGGYAYTDAIVNETNIANQLDARLPDVPKNNAHVWTRYDVVSGPARGLGVGLGIAYNSDRTGTLPTAKSTAVLDLPGYTVTDLALYYAIHHYTVTFKVGNVFDRTYYESAGFTGQINIVPGEPRNFTLALDGRF